MYAYVAIAAQHDIWQYEYHCHDTYDPLCEPPVIVLYIHFKLFTALTLRA